MTTDRQLYLWNSTSLLVESTCLIKNIKSIVAISGNGINVHILIEGENILLHSEDNRLLSLNIPLTSRFDIPKQMVSNLFIWD